MQEFEKMKGVDVEAVLEKLKEDDRKLAALDWIVAELKDQWVEYREDGRVEIGFHQVEGRKVFQLVVSSQVFEGATRSRPSAALKTTPWAFSMPRSI